MLRILRKLLKIAGYMGLVLVVLGIVAYLARDPLRDALAQTVSAQVSKSLNGSFHIGKLRGSLVGSLILQDVVLRDAQDVVVQLDEVRLIYHPLTVLSGRFIVSLVDIVRPRLSLVQAADGTWNLSRIFPSAPAAEVPPPEPSGSGGGLPIPVVLARLQIREGHLALHTAALPGIQRVEDVQMRLHGQMDRHGLQVELQQFTALATPAKVEIKTLQGAVQGFPGNLRVQRLRLQTGNSLVTVHGVLPGGTQVADLAVRMQPLDLSEIGRVLHNDALQGPLQLSLNADGPPQALQLQAQLSNRGGQVDLQSQINMTATPLQYRGTLQVAHLDLAALLGRAALQSDLNLQLRLDGQGLALPDLRGQVTLDIQPSHVGSIALRPSQLQLEALPHRFLVKQCKFDTSVALLTASGAIDTQGTSDLQYKLVADLAHLRQMLGTETLQGKIETRGQLRGELTDIRGQGTLRARDLRFQNNRLADLRLTYEGSDLGGQPQATATLEMRQARVGTVPIQNVQLQATYNSTERQVRFTTEVQQSQENGGTATGQVTFVDAGQHVVLEQMQVRLANRVWTAQLPLDVRLGPGRVRIKPFKLVQANQRLEFSGALEGQILEDIQLQASDIDLTGLRRLVALPEQVNGRASLQIRLVGTLTQPVLQSELMLQPDPARRSPSQRAQITLEYRDKQFQADIRLRQDTREALVLNVSLPVDMAMTALPLEQRLYEAPVTLRLEIQRPDLDALEQWASDMPDVSGTLQGTVTLQGSYAALDLDTNLRLQQLGAQGMVERISGPLQLTAKLITAASLQEFLQALQEGKLAPQIQNLALRIPSLRGELPGQGGTSQPLRLDNFLLQAEGSLTADGVQATLHTLSLQAEAFGIPRTDLTAAGRLTPQQLELTHLQARLPQSQMRLQGTLSRVSQQLQFRLELPRLRLDEFAASLPPTVPKEVQGVVDLQGTIQAPEVKAHLQVAGADITTHVAAQLREATPRYNATLRVKGLQTAQLSPATRGKLDLHLQLQGEGFTPEQRQARVMVRVDTENFTPAPGLTTDLRASLAGNTVQLQQLQLQSALATFEASGTFSTLRDIALSYALSLKDLQSLRQTLGLDLQATGRLTGTVSGTLKALKTQGEIRLDSWRVSSLHGKGMQADFKAVDLLTTPQATLRAHLNELQGPSLPASSIRVDGDYRAPQGRFAVDVTSGPYENTRLAGEIALQEGQRLTLQQLRLQGRGLAWENVQPVEIVRDLQGMLQIARLRLRDGAQEISVGGTLTAAGAVEARLQIQQLGIPSTVQAFAPHATVPEGKLEADFNLRGSLQQPRLAGTLRLFDLRWQRHDLGEVHVTLGMADARLRTELSWQQQAEELLRIQGTLGMTPQAALGLEIKSPSFDLARLKMMHAAVLHSAGRLSIDLRLEGTPQQPLVHGVLELHDGELQLAASGERYKQTQVQLVFTGDRVEIKRFDVGSRSGPVRLTGWIETAGLALRQLDIAMQADQFTAVHRPDLEAVVSAAMQARGSLQEMAVSGNVTVSRARVRVSDKLGGGPAGVEPWQLTVPGVYGPGREAVEQPGSDGRGPRQQAPLPFLRADVTLDIPKNAWVQGTGMAIELRGKMRVTKELQEPFVFDGSIETVRGFASFYGKKFTVREEGKVTFPGTSEINPFLDLAVTHKVSDYVVTIQVGGRAREPKLTLSSEPELEQADIVSLLVIGKTTDRLTASEQKSLSDRGGQVLGGIAAGQLQKALGEPLGLDTVEVEAGDKLGTGRIGVGRYVTQDIFLSYEREIGGEGGNTVGLEYSINRRLKLKGSTSDVGETAVDLFWRLDY